VEGDETVGAQEWGDGSGDVAREDEAKELSKGGGERSFGFFVGWGRCGAVKPLRTSVRLMKGPPEVPCFSFWRDSRTWLSVIGMTG
jgi:hypothetical protein